jgi:hypothetical protein
MATWIKTEMKMEMETYQLDQVPARENYVSDLLSPIPPKVNQRMKGVLLPVCDLLEGENRCKESESQLLEKESS